MGSFTLSLEGTIRALADSLESVSPDVIEVSLRDQDTSHAAP